MHVMCFGDAYIMVLILHVILMQQLSMHLLHFYCSFTFFLVIDMVTKSHLWYMYSTFTLKVIFTYNFIHKSWQITT